jgi:hypothetical protein
MNLSLAGGKNRVAIKDDVCVSVCCFVWCVSVYEGEGGKESDEKAKESKGFLFSSNVIKKWLWECSKERI